MVFFESKFKYNEKQVLYLTNSIGIINGFVKISFWDLLQHYYWKFYKLNVITNNNKHNLNNNKYSDKLNKIIQENFINCVVQKLCMYNKKFTYNLLMLLIKKFLFFI